jgi:hypothetical protein
MDEQPRGWRRPALVVAVIGALTGAILASPVSAHFQPPHEKKHVKKIARRIAKQEIKKAGLGTLVNEVTNIQEILAFTVPPGDTIRGAIGGDFDSPAGAEDWGVIVSLPLKARNDLTDADVHVNVTTWTNADGQTAPTTTDMNAGCTGTVANPTAPAGDVCIYVAGGDNALDLFGYSIVPGTGGSPYGFKLNWTSPAAGDTYIDAVWAYTAP